MHFKVEMFLMLRSDFYSVLKFSYKLASYLFVFLSSSPAWWFCSFTQRDLVGTLYVGEWNKLFLFDSTFIFQLVIFTFSCRVSAPSTTLSKLLLLLPSPARKAAFCFIHFKFLLFCMGVKLGRWHWGRNIGWGCLRTGCWGQYLGLGETG